MQTFPGITSGASDKAARPATTVAAALAVLAVPVLLAAAAATVALAGSAPEPDPRAVSTGGVAATAETGQKAPDFTLRDLDGREHKLSAYLAAGKTVVLEWFNPDCPFVKKHHLANRTMIELETKYRDQGVAWLAVNSGGPGLQGNGLERNRAARKDYAMEYPILLDESGQVGRAYGAKTTPHMFVIAPDGTIVYQGAIDDDRSPQKLGQTNFVRSALDARLGGQAVATAMTQPYGCSVKYSAN